MFDLSLIQQYQKHFLNSCLCGPVLCGLQWKLRAHWSCLLELNGAFYIYPKYFPNIFIFILQRREQNHPCSFGRGTCTGQRDFVLPHPSSSKSLLVDSELFFFSVSHGVLAVGSFWPHQAFCPDPSLPPTFSDAPGTLAPPCGYALSPSLKPSSSHVSVSWDTTGQTLKACRQNCGSSWLLSTLPVCLSSLLSPLFTEAFPEDCLHFPPLILYMVFLIKGEYPLLLWET